LDAQVLRNISFDSIIIWKVAEFKILSLMMTAFPLGIILELRSGG